MKHLTIIASGITLISSYSLAMQHNQHNATFNNNLPKDTVTIFNIDNGQPCSLQPRNEKPRCPIGPNETKKLPVDVYDTKAAMVITTTSMDGTSYMTYIPKPLPKNINFTVSSKKGSSYIDILYDGKLYATVENKHRDIPKNSKPIKL